MFNKILFCIKKEENLAICDKTDKPGEHHAT